MPYGVVAPGISMVYADYADVRRILALYPYTKFRKFKKEEEAWEFVRTYSMKYRLLDNIYKYGDTFSKHYISMEYFIGKDALYYNFDTRRIGYIKVPERKNHIIDNRSNLITVKIENFRLNNETITGHLMAICKGLDVIGEYIDVDIKLHDHSVFYVFQSYSGTNQAILKIIQRIKDRMAKISLTLPKQEIYE